MSRGSRIAVVILAALGLSAAGGSPPAEAQQSQAPRKPSAQQMNAIERMLEDRIYVNLAERAWVGADFKATVDQGTVTLSGTVPSEQTKQGILRTVRRTLGVSEVRDQLRVDPAVGRLRGESPVPNAELAQQVAQKIAGAISGAKAGEDWWFTGWRVEGPYQNWTMVVHALDGAVTIDGEVPYGSTIRKAVQAALQVPGVLSVRSEIEIEPVFYGSPAYYWWHPYGLAHGYHDPDYFVFYDVDRDARNLQGVSTLTGEVTAMDKQKGTLTLKTDSGSFDLKFPPASLANLTQGDTIAVELGLRGADSPAASPAADGSRPDRSDTRK